MNQKKENVQNMPYEKFLQYGPQSLTESELLAVILRTGTKDMSAVDVAAKVLGLAKYPREGLLGLYDVTLEELMGIKGIGLVKAVKLKSLAELSMRIASTKARTGMDFLNASSVADYFMEKLRHRATECVVLLCLDGKGQMISETRLSDGNVKMAFISPREIFIEALNKRAVNIIIVHNHPSGDPTPSRADWKATEDLIEMGKKLEIPLLDHIIIGDNKYTSFRELTGGKCFSVS